MPCTVVTTHELNQFTAAADEEMGRHLHTTQVIEIRVSIESQLIREKLLHILTAVFARRQADGMNDHQINPRIGRAWTKIG